MKVLRLWFSGLLLVFSLTAATAQQIAVAGSPVSSISDRDFNRLFTELRQNGIGMYFPTFQFQEVPEPLSLGFETDFVAPCSPLDPAFLALRATGMKLLLPGEFVYPDPSRIASIPVDQDPLLQIIACAGRENIAGITNYDEAAFHGISIEAVAAFYARVKQIDPSLPVLMVHAPIITDKRAFSSNRKINRYLETIALYSSHADIVGFDVYPIPTLISKVATPLSAGREVEATLVVRDYMAWINATVPDKPKLIVLQGFAYTHLYEQAFLDKHVPANLQRSINAPTASETVMMFEQARAGGAEMIVYWGPSALPDTQSAPWPQILELGRNFGR